MFLYNNCYQFSSIILIVIIAVHFINGLSELKSTDEKHVNNSSNNLLEESSYRRSRLLPHLPSPIYVPLESKKSKKSVKSQKNIKYEDEEEEDEDEEEYSGKAYQPNPYYMPRAIIKYVPIPVYLNKPKLTTTPSPIKTINSLTMDDLMVINMAMKPKPTKSAGYKPMSMGNTGSGYNKAMVMLYGTPIDYNSMGMTDGSVGNYNSMNSGGYGSMSSGVGIDTNSGNIMNGQKYEQNDCAKDGSGQGRECEPYENNGYENMSNQNQYEPINSLDNSVDSNSGSGGSSNYYDSENSYESDNYGSNEENTGFQNNNHINNFINKSNQMKNIPKTSLKYKKLIIETSTTTEDPYSGQDVTTESQSEENMSKAKQIAQVLEMLEKLN